MKKILIPVDFYPFSISAAKTGAFLARKIGAHLHLLHVANIPPGWNKKPLSVRQENPILEGRLVEAEIKLKKFSKSPIFKGVTIFTDVKGDVAFEQIITFAKAHQIHLIVMGAHGAGETSGLFIGSTAQRVLRMAPCPVLSVKKNYASKAIRKIIFASDFEENISRPVNTVKNLATYLKASIDMLYVSTPDRIKNSEVLAKRMHEEVHVQKKVKFNCVVHHDHDKETGVLNYAKKSKAGMIAMVTNLRKRKAGYLLGVTETILFHAEVPMLSFVQK